MKGSDRDFIFNALIKVSELLLKECESLGEIIECPEDAVNVSKRVISHNYEIIESLRELNFNFGENLFEEVEARFIYLIKIPQHTHIRIRRINFSSSFCRKCI